MKVIDADGAVAGRLAAAVAKELLNGESIVIVNSEKAVISGAPKNTFEKYYLRRSVKNKADPQKSPKWPRRPDYLLKKIIKGMLPKKKTGSDAEKRLKCLIGVPKEFEGKAEKITKTSSELLTRFTSLGELCNKLGWKGGSSG